MLCFYYNILDLSVDMIFKLKSICYLKSSEEAINDFRAVSNEYFEKSRYFVVFRVFFVKGSWWRICCLVFYLLFLDLSLGGMYENQVACSVVLFEADSL